MFGPIHVTALAETWDLKDFNRIGETVKNKFKIFVFMLILVFALPFPVSAAENHAPVYVGEKTQIELEKGNPFLITRDEISHWFKDEDGDSLTYWIKVNDSRYIEIEDRCIYIPEGNETVVFTFKANDGDKESEEVALPLILSKRLAVKKESSDLAMLDSLTIHRPGSPEPKEETVLLRNSNSELENGEVFNPTIYSYKLNDFSKSRNVIYDTEPALYFYATSENADHIKVIYKNNSSESIECNYKWAMPVSDLLTAGENKFLVQVGEDGPKYTFYVDVIPTLKNITTKGLSYWEESFAEATKNNKGLKVIVPDSAETLEFSAESLSEGCSITYNGKEKEIVDISDPELDEIIVTVSKDWIFNSYKIELVRKPSKQLKITTNPSNAVITVRDHLGNKIEQDEDGYYRGIFGDYTHTYNISLSGYKTVENIVPDKGGNITINLEKDNSTLLDEVNAEWKNFRGSDHNMAIVDTKLPIEDVAAKWIKKLGNGYTDAPSVQIIVDNALVVMGGQKLYKLDLESGEVLQSANMVEKPNWGYTPPTYGAGMIFCPLSNGTIQAFNAKTLESLWIYKDRMGGQSLSPITYCDGYIYTGFWNQEKVDANYVCIDVRDEDITKTNEAKYANWTHKQNGGFYWAGAVAIGNAIIVGTDDGMEEGNHGSSMLYAFNKATGEIISSAVLSGAGDQRSSIAFDSSNQRIYFTTKGGYLYSAAVDSVSGQFSDLKRNYFGMQSTSTPVVYKNRIYFGVGESFSKGYLAVADVNTLKVLFKVPMKGYPQGSVLLSTAYENTGYLYLYLSYNSPPGGISMIKIKTDCKDVSDAIITEIYDAAGYSQYCISSLICDENGTIFYKNDSAALFAIGDISYQHVIDKIDAIGTVTADSESIILAAREAYNVLNSANKAKVHNYSKLTSAEAILEELLYASIKDVEELISEIGKISLQSNKKINQARKAYDRLTQEEKQKVTNYQDLISAEKTYKMLVNDAVDNVENLIKKIGTVGVESKTSIRNARDAYDQLPEELQELVQNYDDLQAAEKAFSKLSKTTTNKISTTNKTTATTTTSAIKDNAGNKKTPSKPDVLKIQEEMKSVDSSMAFEDALNLLKSFYELDESQRLALEDSDSMKTLQDIVAEHAHVDENTGICIDGVPWNIRIVVKTSETERVFDDIEERMTESDILGLWNICLEDIINGERYIPEKTLKLKIPKSLLNEQKNYSRFSIIHYNEIAEIEVLSTNNTDEYLECDVVEFSHYAVAGFVNGAEMSNEDIQEDNNQFTWVIWIVFLVVGFAALAVILYFRFYKKDEEKTEEIITEIN